MKREFVSDIHGNFEALTAVLADIREQVIEQLYCLGDIVGYGPNPRECIQEMQHADVCIFGNHDEAVIACPDPDGFGPSALQPVKWTRDQLQDEDTKFISSLRRYYQELFLLLVLGSPKDPTNEYVLPMDAHNSIKMAALFD